MPEWMIEAYKTLLKEGGTIDNPDNYIMIQDMDCRIYIAVRKQNAGINYDNYMTLKQFIYRRAFGFMK